MKTSITYSVITGAGKGLGKAFADELASQQRNLLLISRPFEGLSKSAHQLAATYDIEVKYLEIDFLEPSAVDQVLEWLSKYEIDILINNAGIGSAEFFKDASLSDLENIIYVNTTVLSLLTRGLLPKLEKHSPGYILNVSSLSACIPIAYKTVYPATKAFVYSFSRSLAEELKDHNIKVSVLLPGAIKTNPEIALRIDQQGWWVKMGLVEPCHIASQSIRCMLRGKKVIIPGKIDKINWLLMKVLPRAFQIPIVSNAIKHEIERIRHQVQSALQKRA